MLRRLLLILIAVASTAFAQNTLTPEMRHRIEEQIRQATAVPMSAKISITDPVASTEFRGFDTFYATVTGGEGSQILPFLISPDRKRLLYVKSFDLTEDPYERVMRSIDIKGRPVRGTEGAPVSIVVYDDFECPFCAKLYIALLNTTMNQYRDRVQVVLKDFPITATHPWAMSAAIASNCVIQQSDAAYWQYSDWIHTHQQESTDRWKAAADTAFVDIAMERWPSLSRERLVGCVRAGSHVSIDKSVAEGHALGVEATPAMFINGVMYEGALTDVELKAAIDRALAQTAPKAAAQ